MAMTESDGIQPALSSSPQKPADNNAGAPSPAVTAPDVALKICPHCRHSLTTKDVENDCCWHCEKSLKPPPTPEEVLAQVAATKKCPRCGHALRTQDIEDGCCWYCEKRFTDPVEPKKPHSPFLAMFFFGVVGAMLGSVFGPLLWYVLVGSALEHNSWTRSLCAGIGYATGTGLARLLFGRREQGPR
jgi:hypothetical protein